MQNMMAWASGSFVMAASVFGGEVQGIEGDLHQKRAAEVMEHLEENYYNRRSDLYSDKPGGEGAATVWGAGVMFSALAGGARHDKDHERGMRRYFKALDRYWDTQVEIPGYEPLPTQGGGNDKYYDDNAWMVLTFLEAYDITGEKRYLERAEESLEFVLSGWDEQLGGGIWWHEGHKDGSKNTCANAPAALGCYRLSQYMAGERRAELIEWGNKIVAWTVKQFQGDDLLFEDAVVVATGKENKGKLTYNTALMIRNFIALYGLTGERAYLEETLRTADAAQSMIQGNGAYRDKWRWSHLQVEADIELYRLTGTERYLKRAVDTAAHHYQVWKESPPEEMIDIASLARELWLLADLETAAGRAFWERVDRWKPAEGG